MINSFVLAAMAPLLLFPKPQELTRSEGEAEFKNIDAAIKYSEDKTLPKEGYTLEVTPEAILIASSDKAGKFYAKVTLDQLRDGDKLPLVKIKDWPQYPWRGLLLDDCRHFMGKDHVKKTLKAMAMNKMNRLHWHLTDDQAWRIDVPAYPDLVKYGSVSNQYYTAGDLKEVVDFAAKLHITVVPEIEMPGHARAALAAYPQYSCFPDKCPREPRHGWGVDPIIFCAGNPDTFKFLESVLDYVISIFPGEYIHCGGDEAPKREWKACPKCQAVITKAGLDGEQALQTWFTGKMAEYLSQRGKRLIGWDEIVADGLDKRAIVMSWRGTAGGIRAANAGHDVIMTPIDNCYLDYPQKVKDDPYRYPRVKNVTLGSSMMFSPTSKIESDEAKAHILGGQGNVWAEHIFDGKDFDWKAWPRACALAEALWTAPKGRRHYDDMARRLGPMVKRLKELGVNVAPIP